MRHFRFLPLLCLLLAAAHAQTAEWLTGDSGDPSDLQLVFDECEPDGDPRLPVIADATLSFIGSSQQTSIVNFKMTRSVVLNYRLRARSAGQVTIPGIRLRAPASPTGSASRMPSADASTAISRLSSSPLSSTSHRSKFGGNIRATNFAALPSPAWNRAQVNSSCAAA